MQSFRLMSAIATGLAVLAAISKALRIDEFEGALHVFRARFEQYRANP
jgi:hypothetical protein